jgi:hypothetical protein
MPITLAQIQQFVDTSEFKLDPQTIATESADTLDNLYLDAYGNLVDQMHNCVINAASVGMVYEAAKVVFARGEAKRTFDLATAAAMGSPWEYACGSAEDWAVCFARRLVETGDCFVDDEAVNAEVVQRALDVIAVLKRIGFTNGHITAQLSTICHDSEPLFAGVEAEQLNW